LDGPQAATNRAVTRFERSQEEIIADRAEWKARPNPGPGRRPGGMS
jgi:hypothetical protein